MTHADVASERRLEQKTATAKSHKLSRSIHASYRGRANAVQLTWAPLTLCCCKPRRRRPCCVPFTPVLPVSLSYVRRMRPRR